MKNPVILFTVLLILWIAGCTYCYVCNIRDNCLSVPVAVVADIAENKPDTATIVMAITEIPNMLSLYFDFNGITVPLTGEDKQRIDEFKKYIFDNPGSLIDITGHSDHAGLQPVKLKISNERARFVQEQLVAAGIDASRMQVMGKGDSEPAADGNTPEENAKNRRAEIQIK